MHRILRACVGLAILLGSAVAACAGGGGADVPLPDLSINRLLHRFDFEEADDQNFESMPMHWFVVGRPDQTADPNFLRLPMHQDLLKQPGFPKYAKVQFNMPQEQKGDHNLHLALNGGSAAAFLEIGTLAAVPNSDYLVTGRLRTGTLRYARARLLAYFVDGNGKRIEASVVTTDLLQTESQWRGVSVKLQGEHPSAAWIGIQVELVQPQEQPAGVPGAVLPGGVGAHTVVYQDFQGDAWFDDIAVWQVPRIVLRTQSDVNLINAPQQPQLTAEVRDLSGRPLSATLTVYDEHRRAVARMSRKVGGGEGSLWHWAPALPGFGWYLVDMSLYDPTTIGDDKAPPAVARTIRSFLYLPAAKKLPAQQRRRFTLDAQGAALDEIMLLPQVLRATGLNSIAVSAWSSDTTVDNLDARQSQLEKLTLPMLKENAQITLNFSPLPQLLADHLQLDASQPLMIFTKPAKEWSPYLAPILLRQGQNIRSWQFGRPDQAAPSARTAAAALESIESLQRLTPDPRVALPWRAYHERLAELDKARMEYVVDISPSVQPAHLMEHLRDLQQTHENELVLHLRGDDATQMSQSRRVDDFALRFLHAWQADPVGYSVPRPWAYSPGKQGTLHPDPLLGVYASLTHRLASRKTLGKFPLQPGVWAIVFGGAPNSLMAIWSDEQDIDEEPVPQSPGAAAAPVGSAASQVEGAAPARRTIKLFLGDEVSAFDVWGNPVKVPFVGSKHEVPLTSTPLLIEGVDAELALLRASFTVTPALIESQTIAHVHTIKLTNPFPVPISGDLTIIEPGREWRIDPRRRGVTIDPGSTFEMSIEMTPPVNEPAGPKELVVRFEFTTRKQYRIDLRAPMELGLTGIQMETGLSFDKNPRRPDLTDAVATAFITNTGEKQRTIYVFGMLPGHQRQEQILTLKPGQSVLRRFRFVGASEAVAEKPIRVGVRDTAGPALLSHVLKAE